MSPRNHSVSFAESQHHVIDPTNPRGALDDGVEHRLHVRRRAADDAEHLGRCGLMLQRLAQFALRSPSSLNSRTFSMAMTAWSAKVLSSVDLLVGKRFDFYSSNAYSADRYSLSQQGAQQVDTAASITSLYSENSDSASKIGLGRGSFAVYNAPAADGVATSLGTRFAPNGIDRR